MKLTKQQEEMLQLWTTVCKPKGQYHICSWSAMRDGELAKGYAREACFARFGDPWGDDDPDKQGWDLVAFQSNGMNKDSRIMKQILTKFSNVVASTDPEFVKKYGVVIFTKKAGGHLDTEQMLNVFAFFRDFGENRSTLDSVNKYIAKGKKLHAWTMHNNFMLFNTNYRGEVQPAHRGSHIAWNSDLHRKHLKTIEKMKLRKFTVKSLQQKYRFTPFWDLVFSYITREELK